MKRRHGLAAGVLLLVFATDAQAWRSMRSRFGQRVVWRTPPSAPMIDAPERWRPTVETATRRALRTWSSPACTGLRFGPQGTRLRISFAEPTPDKAHLPAWTDVTFSGWGTVRRARVWLNVRVITRSEDPPDLESVILHELGHALGFDHVRSSAVMAPALLAGHARRRLLRDDVAAVCATYPPGVFDASMRAGSSFAGWWWLAIGLCLAALASWVRVLRSRAS